jgi:hypothetical protein
MIMEEMKTTQPHLLVIVVTGTRVDPAMRDIVMALKECLGGAMCQRNVLFIWNKCPTEEMCEENGTTLERATRDFRDKLLEELQLDSSPICLPNSFGQKNAIKPLLDHLATLNVSEPVGIGELRTWDEVIEQAEAVRSPEEMKQQHLQRTRNLIDETAKDLEWYKRMQGNLSHLSNLATVLGTLSGPQGMAVGAAVGRGIETAGALVLNLFSGGAQERLEGMEREYERLQDDQEACLAAAKEAEEARKQRVAELKALVADSRQMQAKL